MHKNIIKRLSYKRVKLEKQRFSTRMDLINHITWLIFKFSLSFRLPRIRKKEVLKLRHWKNTSEEVAALSPFFKKIFYFFFTTGLLFVTYLLI